MLQCADLVDRMAGGSLWEYKPSHRPDNDQLAFHQSPHQIRLVRGGTGSGKTQCTMAELAAAMEGPPYPPWFAWGRSGKCPPPPFKVWVVTQKFPKTADMHAVMEKLFWGEDGVDENGKRIWTKPLICRDSIESVNRNRLIARLKNGVIFEMKSAEQDVSAFEAIRVAIVVVDEPISNQIFRAIKARLVRVPDSRMWLGLTPYEDASEYLYEIMKDDTGLCRTFQLDSRGNIYLPTAQLDELIRTLSPEDFAVRVKGELAASQGRVYPYVFKWPDAWIANARGDAAGKTSNFVEPFAIPKSWTERVVADPGQNNPVAAIRFAVSPNGNLWARNYCYHREPGPDVEQHCRWYREDLGLADPADFARIRRWYIDPWATRRRIPTIGKDHGTALPTLLDWYRKFIPFLPGPTAKEMGVHGQRIKATELYLNPSTPAAPTLFFLDTKESLPLKKEFELYIYDRTGRDREVNNKPKPRDKWDDLMYCVETACALRFKYEPTLGDALSLSADRAAGQMAADGWVRRPYDEGNSGKTL